MRATLAAPAGEAWTCVPLATKAQAPARSDRTGAAPLPRSAGVRRSHPPESRESKFGDQSLSGQMMTWTALCRIVARSSLEEETNGYA
jgi:hypothetical protein